MANISKCVGCKGFPCIDIRKECHSIPDVDVSPESIKMIMISEAPANHPDDNLYASGDPFYLQTTLQAFHDAGRSYSSMKDIIPNGSTYKIRHDKFYYGDIRVFPSYLQTGQNYLIERSKRQMISEDLKNALELIR